MKIDQTGQLPRLIRVFAGPTSFCWFCRAPAHLTTSSHNKSSSALCNVCTASKDFVLHVKTEMRDMENQRLV